LLESLILTAVNFTLVTNLDPDDRVGESAASTPALYRMRITRKHAAVTRRRRSPLKLKVGPPSKTGRTSASHSLYFTGDP
jgi:hypothetical protein